MKLFRLSIVLIAGFLSIPAQAQHLSSGDTLIVGFAGNEPFMVDTGSLSGIAPEIWDILAKELKLQYRSVVFDDVPSALQALEQGKVNAVAGPVSITSSRADYFRFTQPYFQSSLSILSLSQKSGIWKKLAPFFSTKFFIALMIFVLILAIVGTILWLSERKENPEQFPSEPARGIANGMWCAIVTMTTTGYGDIAPRTFWGRFTASAWMIVSLIFATTMIAGIASVLTLGGIQSSTINTAEELLGKRVGVIKDSPSATFVNENEGRVVDMENLEDGYQMLMSHKVDAVVFDRPQLLYFVKSHPDAQLNVSKSEYNKQGYGFAFPLSATDLHQMNVELLQLQESGDINKIVKRWIGKEGT